MALVSCCVPFCGKRTNSAHQEWICRRHWEAVPAVQRKVYARSWDRLVAARAAGTKTPETHEWMRFGDRYFPFADGDRAALREVRWATEATHRLWSRIKRDAIERGVGL